MNTKSQIFDDYSDVKECNDCQHYWNSTCDAATASTRPCKSFLATRRVILQDEVKRLRRLVYWLSACNVACSIMAIVILVMLWRS